MLVFCWPSLRASFGISNTEAKKSFSVLSYNVNVLNTYALKGKKTYGIERPFLDWLVADTAFIKCFQEFYDGKGVRALSEKALQKNGEYESYVFTPKSDRSEKFGLAIFSKYPIVNKGSITFEPGSDNGIAYVDLKLPSTDTLRVINAHLASMALSLDEVSAERSALVSLFLKIKNGFQKRGLHSTLLHDLIIDTPYPLIICGDLNEMPYGYTYQSLRRQLGNAFEAKGNGFGLTFHHNDLPLFRLDQQFYSQELKVIAFETLQLGFSDHYPIRGQYCLE